MENLSKLLDPSYLFAVYPGSYFKYSVFFLVFFGLMIAASFYWRAWRKKHPQRKSLQATLPHFENKLLTLGLVGLLFVGIRYENIPYFSMRFIFGLYLLYVLYVLASSTYRYKTVFPQNVAAAHEKMEQKKYKESVAKRKNKKKKRK
jgi:Ca2+/Na+ antiporter